VADKEPAGDRVMASGPHKRVPEYTAMTSPASGDLLPVVKISDTTDHTSGTTYSLPMSTATHRAWTGADETGLQDSSSLIQDTIDALDEGIALDASVPAYPWITEREGGVIALDGWFRIDSSLDLKNRVSLVGPNYSRSAIVAGSSYTDTSMINAGNITNAFDSRIQHLRIHANNQASITKVINVDSWQEQCGLSYCSIDGYQSGAVGLYVADTGGESAGWRLDNCNFGGFSGCKAAIEVADTVPNVFQFVIEGRTTINSSGLADNGVLFGNGRLYASNLHIERCTHGINMMGGTGLLLNISGTGTLVNLVTLDAGYASRMRAFMLDPNGASGNTWNDLTATNIDYTGFKAFVAYGAD
jgi:hypothetical protein